jgi:glycine cleavage system H protein
MTARPRDPACTDAGKPQPSATAPASQPDGFAVSPNVGPVPAIYVPRSGQTATTALVQRTAAAVARLAHGWTAIRPQHRSMRGTMTDTPADLRYSPDHLWARPGAGPYVVRLGVTDFAQQSLGDVVAVTLPSSGDTVDAGKACGDIESVKNVSDLIAPVTGMVRASNDDLTRTPELVNTDPYGHGWMFEVEADAASLSQQLAGLMDARAYDELAGA